MDLVGEAGTFEERKLSRRGQTFPSSQGTSLQNFENLGESDAIGWGVSIGL